MSPAVPSYVYIATACSVPSGTFLSLSVPRSTTVKMRFSLLLSAGILAPITGLAAPASDAAVDWLSPLDETLLEKRENLCSLKAPPVLCQPNSTITVEETAIRAYKFYRAFVVDGDPRTM